jgi:hypothetical protein
VKVVVDSGKRYLTKGVKPCRTLLLSLYGKIYLLSGGNRPFVFAGAGMYDLDPGTVELGLSAGAGLQLNLLPSFGVEVAVKYHKVNTSGTDFELLSSNAGVRIRF